MIFIYILTYFFGFCLSILFVGGLYNIFFEHLKIKNNIIKVVMIPIFLTSTLGFGYYMPNILRAFKTKTWYQENLTWKNKGYKCIEYNLFLNNNGSLVDLKEKCNFEAEKEIIDNMNDIINKRKEKRAS